MRKLLGVIALLAVVLTLGAMPRAGPGDVGEQITAELVQIDSAAVIDNASIYSSAIINLEHVTLTSEASNMAVGGRRETVTGAQFALQLRSEKQREASGHLTEFQEAHRSWSWSPLLT